MAGAQLEVRDLTIRIPGLYGDVEVVSRVSLEVEAGGFVGLIGESGCGKTLTGLAIMGLLPPGVELAGEIRWRGSDLLRVSGQERRALLGREIAMVYQDAMLSLNPSMTIRRQLRQALRGESSAEVRVRELLDLVHLPDTDTLGRSFPHQLSGGQRQRVLIALALARRPALLIADEPTTALDETVQAQIIELLRDLQDELGFSALFISHNIALARQFCQRTVVMYAGCVVEEGATGRVVDAPRHPYTGGLIRAIRTLEERRRPLATVRGVVPPPLAFSHGCRFSDRCDSARERCLDERPPLTPHPEDDGRYACFYPLPTATRSLA
jgi:peptide/nickel transport system permease protein